jgi:hypothetical protein
MTVPSKIIYKFLLGIVLITGFAGCGEKKQTEGDKKVEQENLVVKFAEDQVVDTNKFRFEPIDLSEVKNTNLTFPPESGSKYIKLRARFTNKQDFEATLGALSFTLVPVECDPSQEICQKGPNLFFVECEPINGILSPKETREGCVVFEVKEEFNNFLLKIKPEEFTDKKEGFEIAVDLSHPTKPESEEVP